MNLLIEFGRGCALALVVLVICYCFAELFQGDE